MNSRVARACYLASELTDIRFQLESMRHVAWNIGERSHQWSLVVGRKHASIAPRRYSKAGKRRQLAHADFRACERRQYDLARARHRGAWHVAGTTNAEAMKRLVAGRTPPVRVVETPGVPEAYDLMTAGSVDAIASDDILLAGLLASRSDGRKFHLVGDFLSFEPYAIGLRRDDPQFAALVRASFAHMASEGYLATKYRQWFTEPLPDGENLGLPMSAQLTEMYRALGQPN